MPQMYTTKNDLLFVYAHTVGCYVNRYTAWDELIEGLLRHSARQKLHKHHVVHLPWKIQWIINAFDYIFPETLDAKWKRK